MEPSQASAKAQDTDAVPSDALNDVGDDGAAAADDELLQWEFAPPVETAFEKSLTTARKNNRRGRGVFGQRGRFGSSAVRGTSNSIGFLSSKKRHALRERQQFTLDRESGHLGDESSPESGFSSRRASLTFAAEDDEDDTVDFGSLVLPTDLSSTFHGDTAEDFKRSASSHSRSQSSIDYQHQTNSGLHSRSSSSISLKNPPVRRALIRSQSVSLGLEASSVSSNPSSSSSSQQKQQKKNPPVRRTLQRSHSLALGTSSTLTSETAGFQSSSTHSLSWSAMKGDFWGENADPNSNNNDYEDLDAIERAGAEPGRKKLRARRHSCLGSTPFNHRESSSSGTSTASSLTAPPHNLPSELGWLAPLESPSKPVALGSYLHDSASALSVFSQASSPAAHSVASSSRKRGVCGSPLSDQDDLYTLSGGSFSDARRTSRSRSRIFSPLPGEALPLAPSLARDLMESNNNNVNPEENISKRNRRDEFGSRGGRGGGGADMDDSSDDESAAAANESSPESSFEVTATDKMDHGAPPPPTRPNKGGPGNDDDDEAAQRKLIFDTMSSYEDLKFLIRELRKEDRRHNSTFGTGDMWKVAPPVNWSSQRRGAFTGWTKGHLGFQVRSAGMGFIFVQIVKDRGTQVLETLEAALIEYKKTELLQRNQEQKSQDEEKKEGEEPPSGLFTAHRTTSPPSFVPIMAPSPSVEAPMSIVKPDFVPSPEDAIMEDAADDLVNKLSSLSMNEPPRSTARSSLSRMVTLPQEDSKKDASLRLSLESRASARPSMDSHAQATTDLNLHMYGSSPRLPLGKPPKMSIGSVAAGAPLHCRSASPLAENVNSSCNMSQFVATPLVNQNRGWGSRPVDGRDWGGSDVYEGSLMEELIQRFEEMCRGDDPTDEFEGDDSFPGIPRESSKLVFDDLEIESTGEFDEDDEVLVLQRKEEERKSRKRQSNINKRRRMSLFATAAGARPRHPRESRASVFQTETIEETDAEEAAAAPAATMVGKCETVMANVFSFMGENDLMTKASTVNLQWADWATDAHANLLLASVASQDADGDLDDEDETFPREPILERSWKFLHGRFPWACFLAEGGAKKVYRVHNAAINREEALSVMDTMCIENVQIVANELAVSAMLSSLVRRAVCPNFIVMRGVFTMAHAPPASHWGDDEQKQPKGREFVASKNQRCPKTPKDGHPGRYQYIRMELVNEGDAEELIKRQKDESFPFEVARGLLFQIAFALFAAADKYSMKHYDVKLLNIFVHRVEEADQGLVLRYGLGSHTFAVNMPAGQALIAKLADFGTANTVPASNGQPVTMAHFTTLENTPPDFMILGDDATQGHEHDSFGLGLCMLHLFSGYRPYEEIMEDVHCPPHLKKFLRKIWENEKVGGFSVLRTVISDDPDEIMYDTLYRFLVLFGIPEVKFQQQTCPKVWKAISDALEFSVRAHGGRPARKRVDSDVTQYNRDCKRFSLRRGNNKYIARARNSLNLVNGGLDLLLGLCSFDPKTRATAMNVLNSPFMEGLRETPGTVYTSGEIVRSYNSFATHS